MITKTHDAAQHAQEVILKNGIPVIFEKSTTSERLQNIEPVHQNYKHGAVALVPHPGRRVGLDAKGSTVLRMIK